MRRLAPLLVVLALAGCGLGAGSPPGGVRLTVSEDFGARTLVENAQPEHSGDETVMRLLQRNAKVSTRFGGNFVQSIDGRAGGRRDGRPVDWFFYVNGIESSTGATEVKVRDGDSIWWDRHDWGETLDIPAVVGAFPEPFLHGVDGERLPVRVECGTPRAKVCRDVGAALREHGLVAGQSLVGSSPGTELLRVLVGPWEKLRRDRAVRALERGPRASGVFARVAADGREIEALDARGRVARRLGAGSGLVAATQAPGQMPAWVVTGTDEAGIASAVRAFAQGETTLRGKFALAIGEDRGVPLPVPEGR